MNNATYFADLMTRLIEANRAQEKAIGELAEFEERIEKAVKKAIKGYPFDVRVCFRRALTSTERKPFVGLTSRSKRDGRIFVSVKNRGWLWVNPFHHWGVYQNEILSPQPPPPFDVVKLKAIVEKLSEEWGVPISFEERNYVDRCRECSYLPL